MACGRALGSLLAHRWGPLVLVVVLALLLRAIHLGEVHDTPLFLRLQTDQFEYHEWAKRIVAGDWAGRNEPVFYQGPLYPYALALLYALTGPSRFAAAIVQVMLSTGTVALVYLLGRRLLGPTAAFVASLACACYGLLIFMTSLLLAETLLITCQLGMLCALEAALRRRRLWLWGLTGALLGLCATARATILLFAPVVVIAAVARPGWRAWRRWLPRLGVAAATTLLAIAPATLHNRLLGDDWVLVSYNGGTNLFIGNNAGSDGIYQNDAVYRGRPMGLSVKDQLASYPAVAKRELGRDDLKPSEISGFWVDRALAEIRADPGRWLDLEATKLRHALNDYDVPNVRNYYFSQRFSRVLRLPLPSFGWLLPFAVVGAVACSRSLRQHGLLIGYVAAQLAGLLLFFVNDRYRLPVVPAIALLGAHGLGWLAARARERSWTKLGLGVGGALLAVVVAFLPVSRTSFRADLLNLGNAHRDLGQLEQAIASYDEALGLSPDFYYAHFKRAEVLFRLGRRDEARAGARRALGLARRAGDTLNAGRIQGLLDRLGGAAKPEGPGRATDNRCGQ